MYTVNLFRQIFKITGNTKESVVLWKYEQSLAFWYYVSYCFTLFIWQLLAVYSQYNSTVLHLYANTCKSFCAAILHDRKWFEYEPVATFDEIHEEICFTSAYYWPTTHTFAVSNFYYNFSTPILSWIQLFVLQILGHWSTTEYLSIQII